MLLDAKLLQRILDAPIKLLFIIQYMSAWSAWNRLFFRTMAVFMLLKTVCIIRLDELVQTFVARLVKRL